jgi:hypothetical protein
MGKNKTVASDEKRVARKLIPVLAARRSLLATLMVLLLCGGASVQYVQRIIFDVGDDGGNDSVAVREIATTGDANAIFTESADKVTIAVGNNWPTADVANAGDSATSFFTAGTVEHERGGLEADVSGYSGVLAITGGATYELNTLAELNTALGSSIADGAHTVDTTLTQEQVEDFFGAMVSGNTETLVTVTYQDGDGTIDFVVDPDLGNYSWTNVDATDLKVGTLTQGFDTLLDDIATDGFERGSDVSLTDVGAYFTTDNAEAALQQLGASAAAALTNPMTTAEDLIVGGASGTPERLAIGTEGQVVKVVSGVLAFATDATGAGGSAITLDLGDDGGNDSTDVTEIATSGDTNNIFTEPAADKILVDVSQNWPNSDSADVALTGDSATGFFSTGTLETTLLDADLQTYAGITPSANVQSLLGAASYAAMRTLLDLEAGTDFYSISAADAAFQPLDSDLTLFGAITPSANVQSYLGSADYAAMRTLLDLEAGTDFYSIAAADAEFVDQSPILVRHAGSATLGYATLASAMAAVTADSGDVIYILEDIALSSTVTLKSGVDIVGPGATVVGASGVELFNDGGAAVMCNVMLGGLTSTLGRICHTNNAGTDIRFNIRRSTTSGEATPSYWSQLGKLQVHATEELINNDYDIFLVDGGTECRSSAPYCYAGGNVKEGGGLWHHHGNIVETNDNVVEGSNNVLKVSQILNTNAASAATLELGNNNEIYADYCQGWIQIDGASNINLHIGRIDATASTDAAIFDESGVATVSLYNTRIIPHASATNSIASNDVDTIINLVGACDLGGKPVHGDVTVNYLADIDGEQILDDSIDDDSIDFADVTLADLTFDVGSVDVTEFGYLNGVTSAIQTQLDAKQDAGTIEFTLLVTDPNGDALSVADGVAFFPLSSRLNGMDLVSLTGQLTTASTAGGDGAVSIQLHNVTDASDVLTVNLTFDQGETTTASAAAGVDIDEAEDDVNTDDQWRVDIDAAGTDAKGLSLTFVYQLP